MFLLYENFIRHLDFNNDISFFAIKDLKTIIQNYEKRNKKGKLQFNSN